MPSVHHLLNEDEMSTAQNREEHKHELLKATEHVKKVRRQMYRDRHEIFATVTLLMYAEATGHADHDLSPSPHHPDYRAIARAIIETFKAER